MVLNATTDSSRMWVTGHFRENQIASLNMNCEIRDVKLKNAEMSHEMTVISISVYHKIGLVYSSNYGYKRVRTRNKDIIAVRHNDVI